MTSVRASSVFRVITAAALALALPSAAFAGPTPEKKCESGKNSAAGKYAACLHKAQQKFVSGGEIDTAARDAAILNCGTKYSEKWASLESKAMPTGCQTTGDVSSIQDFLDACIFSTADALGGAPLPSDVVTCNDDLGTCSGSLTSCNSNYATCSGSLTTCNGNFATCNSDLSTTNSDLTSCTGDLGICDADLVDCNGDLSATNADLTTCEGDLADCEAEPRAQTLKTGQTDCYNAAGTVIACSATGQDGDVQAGVPRYLTDNGDGTITDHRTGLMWEKLSNDGTIHDKDDLYTWTNAFAVKVDGLNTASFAGHSDWRLPNLAELETLRKMDASNPMTSPEFNTACPASCSVTSCSCTEPDWYWTSTTSSTSLSSAWITHFGDGDANQGGKGSSYAVRAVRTQVVTEPPPAQPLKTGQTICSDEAGSVIACAGTGQDADFLKGADNSFTDNGDGTITDNSTGLMWEKLSDDGSIHDVDTAYTWTTAVTTKMAALNSAVFAGHSDWRVPNRRELETLVNLGAVSPATFSAFDAACAPGCTVLTCSCTQSSSYWSSSTYQYGPTNAWHVVFFSGGTLANLKTSNYYVRAVRAGS